MIEKYTISKDDKYYRAFTDLIEINGKLICSFAEMNKEIEEYNICYCESYDKGKSWSEIYKMPISACHRPIITKLKSDNYLITYRFDYANFVGTRIHGNIFMGCICTKDDLLETNRDKIIPRIFPIDYDRNINSNCGYSSQVELDDGTIYVTSHIVDDNPVSQIRGYRFREKDLIIK